jgi:hypothetical protein
MENMIGKRLNVTLEIREDGGLRVRSDELRGLILSGSDPAKVLADIIPAWTVLANWPTASSLPAE